MLGLKIIRNCIIAASACMFVLATFPEGDTDTLVGTKVDGSVQEKIERKCSVCSSSIDQSEASTLCERSVKHSTEGGVCQKCVRRLQEMLKVAEEDDNELQMPKTTEKSNDALQMLKKMSPNKICSTIAGVSEPAFIEEVADFICNNMLYAQLNNEQLLVLGKYLFTLAKDDDKDNDFEEYLSASFFTIGRYIRFSLSVLPDAGIASLFDLTKTLALKEIQQHMLQDLQTRDTGSFSLECRAKLATLTLLNLREPITNRLCMLKRLGYFKFESRMREEIIELWKKRKFTNAVIKDKPSTTQEDAPVLKILSFEPEKSLEEVSESKTYELLEQIYKNLSGRQSKGTQKNLQMLKLQFYHCMLHLPSPTEAFSADVYDILKEIDGVLAIVPFAPSAGRDSRGQETLVSSLKSLVSSDTVCDELISALYLHSGIAFQGVLSALFDPDVQKGVFQLSNLKAMVMLREFFKKDLGEAENATALFKKLKDARLYILMPLFEEYFTKEVDYEGCIAANMSEISDKASQAINILYLEFPEIIYKLCRTNNEEISRAFFQHFFPFLRTILGVVHAAASLKFQYLRFFFSRDAFVKCVTKDQLENLPWFILLEVTLSASPFCDFMDLFFSAVKDEQAREAVLTLMKTKKFFDSVCKLPRSGREDQERFTKLLEKAEVGDN